MLTSGIMTLIIFKKKIYYNLSISKIRNYLAQRINLGEKVNRKVKGTMCDETPLICQFERLALKRIS